MHRRITYLLALASLPCALAVTAAQQPVRTPKPVVQRDTTAKPDSVEADSTSDDEDVPPHAITTGLSFGGLNYDGGRSERATSAVLRWRALPWLSIGATPTFARSLEPNVIATRADVSKSGLTDLPIEISADHSTDLTIYEGSLMTDGGAIVRFFCPAATDGIVDGTWARFRGVFVQEYDYANVAGGQTKSLLLVGTFNP